MSTNLRAANPERRPLPRIDDLYQNVELAGKHNELNRLLNCSPKPEWVKVNTFAQNSKYIPIGIIEYLLTSIYIQWKVEIKEVKLIANSVAVTVRLWAMSPITGEWEWNDGVGAAPLKTAKGAKATNFEHILDSSVQTGAPAAESYAIKDAAEKWGKIFGKDLNRKDEHQMNYGGLEGKLLQSGSAMLEEIELLMKSKGASLSIEDRVSADRIIKNRETNSYPKLIKILKSK